MLDFLKFLRCRTKIKILKLRILPILRLKIKQHSHLSWFFLMQLHGICIEGKKRFISVCVLPYFYARLLGRLFPAFYLLSVYPVSDKFSKPLFLMCLEISIASFCFKYISVLFVSIFLKMFLLLICLAHEWRLINAIIQSMRIFFLKKLFCTRCIISDYFRLRFINTVMNQSWYFRGQQGYHLVLLFLQTTCDRLDYQQKW